jgi:hypothetical protein
MRSQLLKRSPRPSIKRAPVVNASPQITCLGHGADINWIPDWGSKKKTPLDVARDHGSAIGRRPPGEGLVEWLSAKGRNRLPNSLHDGSCSLQGLGSRLTNVAIEIRSTYMAVLAIERDAPIPARSFSRCDASPGRKRRQRNTEMCRDAW